MNPFAYVAHLWAVPPVDLSLPCPAAASGQSTNPTGHFDNATVMAAFNSAALWSTIAVIAIILFCYMATRKASGPRFDKRWVLSGVASLIICGVISYAALHFAHTTAAANSCESNPNAFAWALPDNVVLNRTIAGLVWGALAFALGSFIFTRAFGWYPSLTNGFYHNRGTPWPRLLTGGK